MDEPDIRELVAAYIQRKGLNLEGSVNAYRFVQSSPPAITGADNTRTELMVSSACRSSLARTLIMTSSASKLTTIRVWKLLTRCRQLRAAARLDEKESSLDCAADNAAELYHNPAAARTLNAQSNLVKKMRLHLYDSMNMHIAKYTGPLCRKIFGAIREHPLPREIRDTIYANFHGHRTFDEMSFRYNLRNFTAAKSLTFGPSMFEDSQLTISVTVSDELNGGG